MLRVAFMFVVPGSNAVEHRSVVTAPAIEVTTVGVSTYEEAEAVTKELVASGIQAIELCGAFGFEGVARVSKAAGDKALVGVVRFDKHPALGCKSGDEL